MGEEVLKSKGKLLMIENAQSYTTGMISLMQVKNDSVSTKREYISIYAEELTSLRLPYK